MEKYDFPQLIERLNSLAEVYAAKPVTETGGKAWVFALRIFPTAAILAALDSWLMEKTKMPTPADIAALAKRRSAPRDPHAYDAALARSIEQANIGKEDRLSALCDKFGVPLDMEQPMRDQTLVKTMMRQRPLAGAQDGPNLVHMHAICDAVEGKRPAFPRRLADSEIAAAYRATGRRAQPSDQSTAWQSVTPDHGPMCTCQICYPKRMHAIPREPGQDDEERQ